MKKVKQYKAPATGTRRKYSMEEKVEILRVLKDNSYDYKKTSVQTGCNYGTLKMWYVKYKDNLANLNAVDMIAEKTELNLSKAKIRFIERHYNQLSQLAETSIGRALELLKDEKDLNKVNDTIKIVTDYFAKLSTSEEQKETGNSLIQQTIIALNSFNKPEQ